MHAYHQIFQSAVTCLMALAHFPYLERIDAKTVQAKLDD